MKLSTRSRSAPELPGLRGTARADRRTRSLLSRLQPGDIAVLDHHDLDRGTAQALVDAEVGAVLNASPMLSGRFPALGPQVLADAGVPVVDTLGRDLLLRVREGAALRVADGEVYAGDDLLAEGRVVDPALVDEGMSAARDGLTSQLESFTHNSTEFLRREQDLLLHGRGVPDVSTRIEGRPVVVVVDGHDVADELRGITRYLAEQNPVLIGVEGGAEALVAAGHQPHVVVVDATTPDDALLPAKVLRRADDVVLRCDRGARSGHEPYERLGLRPLRFESGATAEDAALVLASAHDARLIVGVGLHASLEDFLDRQRPGLASTYLTRLTVGERLVDARSLPSLYSGRVRPWHLFAVLLVGLLALAAAIAVTPVGQEWVDAARPHVADLVDRVRTFPEYVRGLL